MHILPSRRRNFRDVLIDKVLSLLTSPQEANRHRKLLCKVLRKCSDSNCIFNATIQIAYLMLSCMATRLDQDAGRLEKARLGMG